MKYEDRRETTLESSRDKAHSAAGEQVSRMVESRINTEQLASDAFSACKSVSASSGMTLGQVVDSARPILERVAASQGITLSHADLDRFENSLQSLVKKASNKSKGPGVIDFPVSNSQGNPASLAAAKASGISDPQSASIPGSKSNSLSQGALFADNLGTADAQGNPAAKGAPLAKIMSALRGEHTATPVNTPAAATAMENSSPTNSAVRLSVGQLEKLLTEPFAQALNNARSNPLELSDTRSSRSAGLAVTQREPLKAEPGSWAGGYARTAAGSFGAFVREAA